MALIDTIRAKLRTVVGSTAGLGEQWHYQALTSAPTTQIAPAYATAATVDAVASGYHIAEVPDQRTGRLVRRERQFLRISDAISLPIGSLVYLTSGTLWSVDELDSSAGGTARYLIGRALTERGQSNRGGGP